MKLIYKNKPCLIDHVDSENFTICGYIDKYERFTPMVSNPIIYKLCEEVCMCNLKHACDDGTTYIFKCGKYRIACCNILRAGFEIYL